MIAERYALSREVIKTVFFAKKGRLGMKTENAGVVMMLIGKNYI